MIPHYVSSIKGNKYYYISDSYYINKGNSKQTSLCVGRVDKLSKEALEVRKFEAMQRLATREATERARYWIQHVASKAVYTPDVVKKLENLRCSLYSAKNAAGDASRSMMEAAFLIDFIYNSNRVEGSRLKRNEVQKLLFNDKNKNNEVSSTIRAIEYLGPKRKFSTRTIEEAQRILMSHEPSKVGFRKEQVIVGDSDVSHWRDVKEQMKRLLEWFEEKSYKLYPPELAFEFYYRFERVHPFLDGNGRTGRALMNQILKIHRYHPMIIWNKNRDSHFRAFDKRTKSDHPSSYLRFMNDQMKKTHQLYLERLKDANKLEHGLMRFLSPSE